MKMMHAGSNHAQQGNWQVFFYLVLELDALGKSRVVYDSKRKLLSRSRLCQLQPTLRSCFGAALTSFVHKHACSNESKRPQRSIRIATMISMEFATFGYVGSRFNGAI